MEPIQPNSFVLEIIEYGAVVRKYNDTNYDRFMSVSKEMINDHIVKYSCQKSDEVKNITFNIFTY